MRITVLRHSIRNRGGDKLVLDYLAYLAGKGHEITYWTNEVQTHFPIPGEIKIKKIPLPGIIGTLAFSWFKKFDTDVLLVDLVVLAFFASFQNRQRIIYLAQGNDVSYYKSQILKSFTKFCYKKVLGEFLIPTVCVSDGLAETLKTYSPKRIVVITNGVSLKKFYREQDSSYLKNRTKKFTILLFSRKDHAKGFDIAEQALRRLDALRPEKDWELWTIGEDKVEWDFVHVQNFGFQSDENKLREILSAIDIFLIPSRSEGLSLLLLQALACKNVIISTRASSILTHEVEALISPVEDTEALAQNLNRVLSNEAVRNHLRNNTRALAQKFDLEKSCSEFENFLKSLPRS